MTPRLLPLLGCLLTVPLAAQHADDALAQARVQLQTNHLDSAAALLRRITDSAAWNDSLRRINAFVLLGIVRYYQGDDSATRAAFSEALTLNPVLTVPQLAQLDSVVAALLESARVAVASAPSPDTLYSCSPHCVGVDVAPQPIESDPTMVSRIVILTATPAPGADPMHGSALLRAIVDTLGRVEPGSVEVVHSTLPQELLDAVLQSLMIARYHPGRVRGRAVRVLIERRVDIRPRTH